jgi:O-acetyl-ADP-ribose deacetylase (regulator of RNase III)
MPHARRLRDRRGQDHARLSAEGRHVIHTVGPIWEGGSADEERLLANAYANSLKLAEAHGLGSIAFPAISTGVYGFRPTEPQRSRWPPSPNICAQAANSRG